MKNIHTRPSLLFCIIMDLIGYASYAIPGIGEISDVIWAPLSGAIFVSTFGGKKGIIGGIFNFFEEALPGTDFIPSFTIMWFLTNRLDAFGKKTIIPVKSK